MDTRAHEPLPAFYALLFNFARYLLISSSQPGNWPANEGGIWCEDLCGPEETQYHFDNNIQQNYWPADVSNLIPQPTMETICLVLNTIYIGLHTMI